MDVARRVAQGLTMIDNLLNTKANQNCRFCDIFSKVSHSSGEVDRPWMAADGFSALVSIGALVPGWTLLCPDAHATNMLESFRSEAFWTFADNAERIVRHRFGAVSIFEHGARHTGSLTGCGVNHAHLHMVPLDFSLVTESLRFDNEINWKRCAITQIDEFTDGSEYLFVADSFEGAVTTGLVASLEDSTSQFFRRVIASRLGLPDFYDYRRFPMTDIAEVSALNLREDACSQGLLL